MTEINHLKYKHFIDEQVAKTILANKIIDDNLKTSVDSRYVELRRAIETKDSFTEFNLRKFAFFYEMDKIGGDWKVSWEDEMVKYYKHLPYHDEVNIYLDGKHIFIPKKTGLENIDKMIQENTLDPVLKNMLENLPHLK